MKSVPWHLHRLNQSENGSLAGFAFFNSCSFNGVDVGRYGDMHTEVYFISIYKKQIDRDRVHSMPARWFHSLTLLESSMMNCVPC